MRVRLLWAVCAIGVLLAVSQAETDGTDLIVLLKDNQAIDRIHRENGTRTVRKIANAPIYLIRVDDDDDDRVLRKLRRDRAVENVEKNRSVKLFSSTTSSRTSPVLGQNMEVLVDGRSLTTFYGTYVLKAYVEQPTLRLIGVNLVRNISNGASARVGTIDTGADIRHPALRPWLEPGVDLVSNSSVSELEGLSQAMEYLLDQNMEVLVDNRFMFLLNQNMESLLDTGNGSTRFPPAFGHGTLVAGIIHLVAPEARIVLIRAFNGYGYSTLFTIIEAVYKAIQLDLDVLNMSFSTTGESEIFRKALDKARAVGIALVASVGNDGRDAKGVKPASYPGVYGVATTDLYDRLAGFSNRGKPVSITAPGVAIISTSPGGHYSVAWGTSFSAPFVSGAAALLASTRPYGQSQSPLVINTADNIDHLNPGLEKEMGRGRLNVYEALKAGR